MSTPGPCQAVPAEVTAAIGRAVDRARPFPLDVRWCATLASTMDAVAAAVDRGAAEGLVIVAHEQTAGRGRRGRSWRSPPGAGVYASFLFTPEPAVVEAGALATVTLAVGVAVRRAISEASGFEPELKWPNDVMVGRRKLAGILAEGVGLGGAAPRVVIGTGINVQRASYPPDVAARATSIEDELGRTIDAALVLEALLVAVPDVYRRLCAGGADDILREWRAAAPAIVGARIEWDTAHGVKRGVSAGVAADGSLLARTETGTEPIVGGEVRWL